MLVFSKSFIFVIKGFIDMSNNTPILILLNTEPVNAYENYMCLQKNTYLFAA